MDGSSHILVLIFYGVILGLVGALIGKRKGRQLGGFCLGFFLGPIGWLLVGFGPDYTNSATCPFCAERIKPEARVCKHCGRDIVQPAAQAQAPERPLPPLRPVVPPPRNPTTFKFSCPNCGQRISASSDLSGTDAACPECQFALIVPNPENA